MGIRLGACRFDDFRVAKFDFRCRNNEYDSPMLKRLFVVAGDSSGMILMDSGLFFFSYVDNKMYQNVTQMLFQPDRSRGPTEK